MRKCYTVLGYSHARACLDQQAKSFTSARAALDYARGHTGPLNAQNREGAAMLLEGTHFENGGYIVYGSKGSVTLLISDFVGDADGSRSEH